MGFVSSAPAWQLLVSESAMLPSDAGTGTGGAASWRAHLSAAFCTAPTALHCSLCPQPENGYPGQETRIAAMACTCGSLGPGRRRLLLSEIPWCGACSVTATQGMPVTAPPSHPAAGCGEVPGYTFTRERTVDCGRHAGETCALGYAGPGLSAAVEACNNNRACLAVDTRGQLKVRWGGRNNEQS